MDNQQQDDLPPTDPDPEQKPSYFRQGVNALLHLGLGEIALRFGSNFLSILVIVAVVWLMQTLYRGPSSGEVPVAGDDPSLSDPLTSLLMPEAISASLQGISRQAIMHTSIPSRPRIDVITYTVQLGDSVFGIAGKFNLNPSTILFGNWETLKGSPDSLRPDQVLNILPVDGAYYQWQATGTETLTGIAAYFGVEPELIVNFPGNQLDLDAIGPLDDPNIAAGTWLVIPGGRREFSVWTAPVGLIRLEPAATVIWGPGACGTINQVQVGYGTFVWPAPKHWLSGTPYLPDIKHYAIDLAAQLGDAAYATDAGTVVYAGWNTWGYGNLIVLDHGNGWQSLYAHLDGILVGCGQTVGQGDIIGLLGSTGNSTGPHLHFELMHEVYGHVNPLNMLPSP